MGRGPPPKLCTRVPKNLATSLTASAENHEIHGIHDFVRLLSTRPISTTIMGQDRLTYFVITNIERATIIDGVTADERHY
jgi:hypothetical protein